MEERRELNREMLERIIKVEHGQAVIATELKGYREGQEKTLCEVVEGNKKLTAIIVGDGLNPGISEDVRKLKDEKRNRESHMKIIWTAIVAGIAERFFHYFTGK